MGTRSKQLTSDKGAFGSKKWVRFKKVVPFVPPPDMPEEMRKQLTGLMVNETHIISVKRPNRGRYRGIRLRSRHGRTIRFKNVNLVGSGVEPKKQEKLSTLGRVRRLFQRKGA